MNGMQADIQVTVKTNTEVHVGVVVDAPHAGEAIRDAVRAATEAAIEAALPPIPDKPE